MKFEDENFKEEFMKWLNSKTEEEILQKLKELEEDKKMSADEMFKELGYKKKNLDIIFSRFWEEWENQLWWLNCREGSFHAVSLRLSVMEAGSSS